MHLFKPGSYYYKCICLALLFNIPVQPVFFNMAKYFSGFFYRLKILLPGVVVFQHMRTCCFMMYARRIWTFSPSKLKKNIFKLLKILEFICTLCVIIFTFITELLITRNEKKNFFQKSCESFHSKMFVIQPIVCQFLCIPSQVF